MSRPRGLSPLFESEPPLPRGVASTREIDPPRPRGWAPPNNLQIIETTERSQFAEEIAKNNDILAVEQVVDLVKREIVENSLSSTIEVANHFSSDSHIENAKVDSKQQVDNYANVISPLTQSEKPPVKGTKRKG